MTTPSRICALWPPGRAGGRGPRQVFSWCALIWWLLVASAAAGEAPFLESEFLFPPESWHNHGSCIVETPRGDLLVCWFHGSGERKADDARIEGARRRKGARVWGERFTMADTPEFPDTNCAMMIDPAGRLWLFWPTILDNHWESALLKYRVARRYEGKGAPEWERSDVLHVKPGPEFGAAVRKELPALEGLLEQQGLSAERREEVEAFLRAMREDAEDKLKTRLGWMTRAHPVVIEGRRLLVPLYHDGFSFSLMAMSDDWGGTWRFSEPLVGAGNVQPSVVRRRDGSLYTLMRDNGPPPKRLLQSSSRDGGRTWDRVTDSAIPNPGSGAEIIVLRNGGWVLISNDTEEGRHRLAAWLSDDEGQTWKWRRNLEDGPASGSYSYPSILQARDGTLHVTYSHHVGGGGAGVAEGKTIKHAHFNEAWVRAGSAVP